MSVSKLVPTAPKPRSPNHGNAIVGTVMPRLVKILPNSALVVTRKLSRRGRVHILFTDLPSAIDGDDDHVFYNVFLDAGWNHLFGKPFAFRWNALDPYESLRAVIEKHQDRMEEILKKIANGTYVHIPYNASELGLWPDPESIHTP